MDSQTPLTESNINFQPINKKTKCNMCDFLDLFLKMYFVGFGAITVYYLYSMDNRLLDFNNKIISVTDVGKCLFKDICYDFKLGRDMCGNCYSNMSSIWNF